MEMKDWSTLWMDEAIERADIDKTKICNFGIKALDDSMIGIFPNDLIVIGADSGVGKSEIALNMALHNASAGKKVALYFIEGGAKEAIRRIKWSAIKDKYFRDKKGFIDLDYRKWRLNMLNNPLLEQIENECLLELNLKIKGNLEIYDFESSFTVNDLHESLGKYMNKSNFSDRKLNVDIIIIDHLQYFNLESAKNEFNEMTQILMQIKNITNFWNIPVVLISHLRKKDKDRGLPNQEDFFGTSNIAKIARQAITISPDYSFDNHSDNIYPTFFRIVKSGTGLRSSFSIRCNFDLRRGKYQDEYELYRLSDERPLKNPMTLEQLPKWASKQQQPRENWQDKES
jgi:archaellum biogenesis ATPase FlaH